MNGDRLEKGGHPPPTSSSPKRRSSVLGGDTEQLRQGLQFPDEIFTELLLKRGITQGRVGLAASPPPPTGSGGGLFLSDPS